MRIFYLLFAIIVSVVVTYYLLTQENREPIVAVLLGGILGLFWPFVLLIGILTFLDDNSEENTNEDSDPN